MLEAIPQKTIEEQHMLLLSTKFSPPLMRPVLVARPQLIERLNKAVQQQLLTLISAPAGSGKSTLLSSWYTSYKNSKDMAFVWISLEKSDNDSVRFWTTFITALQKDFPDFGHNALMTLRASQTYSLEAVIHVLLQDISLVTEQCVLAFTICGGRTNPRLTR